MAERIRRVRDLGRNDQGMTLTEMLVSMIVFAIAMAMITSATILVMRTTDDAQQSAQTVTELRQAVAVIDRQVRSGNVLFSPANEPGYVASCQAVGTNAGTCMRIFTQANGTEKCVQWQVLDDGSGRSRALLRMRSWALDWQTGGQVSDWKTVARDLRLGTTAPFTLLGASTPYKERALQLHVVGVDERSGREQAVDSTLTGRNTSYGYDSGQCTPVPPA